MVLDHTQKLHSRDSLPILIQPVVFEFLYELWERKGDDTRAVGGDMIFHTLIADPSDDFSDLFICRNILDIKVPITVIIVSTYILGIEVPFSHNGTFSGTLLFHDNVTGAFVQHNGVVAKFWWKQI